MSIFQLSQSHLHIYVYILLCIHNTDYIYIYSIFIHLMLRSRTYTQKRISIQLEMNKYLHVFNSSMNFCCCRNCIIYWRHTHREREKKTMTNWQLVKCIQIKTHTSHRIYLHFAQNTNKHIFPSFS